MRGGFLERTNMAIIILGILSLSGFGLSGYILISNLSFIPVDDQDIVVGFWNTLDDNKDFAPYNESDSFLVEFQEQEIINNDYIKMSNSDTTFSLLKPGLYKIRCLIYLQNIDDSNSYYIRLIEGTTPNDHIFYSFTLTGCSPYILVNADISIVSDGNHEYRIQAYSLSGDTFYIFSSSTYNQLTIEYVRS